LAMKRKQVSNAPGWDAIDQAVARLYPGVEPMHLATLVSWQLGGDDPLDGISIFPAGDHWHFIGYGMSELYDKTSELAEQSGWGFEFTIRVARRPGEREAPMWAANLLQNLGRYVYNTGNWFDAGHQMDLNGPIALNRPDTALRAIAFAEDPELGQIDTPHGTVSFLQVVGLTEDEYASTQLWSTLGLLEVLRRRNPLLLTDLDRTSALADPVVAREIAHGQVTEGSSTGGLYLQEVGWSRDDAVAEAGAVPSTTLVFGAHPAPRVAATLAARLPFGRDLDVQGPDQNGQETGIRFVAAAEDSFGFVEQEGWLVVSVPASGLAALTAALLPQAGERAVAGAPGLTVSIVRSQIRDAQGAILEEIG
jgi:suppressor of fused